MLSAQDLRLILSDKERTEKDLWKKERINYLFDSKDLNESYAEGFYYRGQEKLEEGLYEEAISDFKKAIANEKLPAKLVVNGKEMPSRKTAYLLISGCFQQLNENDSALFYCRKSIETDRFTLASHIQLAFILMEMGRYAEADQSLKQAEEVFPGSGEVPYARANLYLKQNKITKAKKLLKKAIATDPDFEEANLMLVSIYLENNDADAAMRVLNRAVKTGKEPTGSLYYRMLIYLYTNNIKKAYKDAQQGYLLDTVNSVFASALSSLDYYFANFPRALRLGNSSWKQLYTTGGTPARWLTYERYEYGYFLQYLTDHPEDKEALKTFNKYVHKSLHELNNDAKALVNDYAEEYPDSLFALRLRLYAHMKNREKESWIYKSFDMRGFSQEITFIGLNSIPKNKNYLFKAVIEKDSTVVSIYWLKSFYMLEQARLREAIIYANKAIAIDGSALLPYTVRGVANLHLKNYDPAIEDLTLVMENVPNPQNFYGMLALANFKAGNYEKAAKYNNKLLAYRQMEIDLLNQALCYEKAGMPDSALVYFKKLSAFKPLNSDYTRLIALTYKKMGDYDAALKVLKTAKKREFSDFILLVDIADLYTEMGQYENAIVYYEDAFRKDGNYTYAYLGAADCYAVIKSYLKAVKLYDRAIESKPDHAYSYFAKALCLARMQDYEQSNIQAYKAVEIDEDYAAAYLLMSKNFFETGRYAVSISMGLKALKFDQENKETLYQLAASSLARGNIGEATALYERVLATEEEAGSDAYKQAIETLNGLIAKNIRPEDAKIILEKVFGEQSD